MLGLSAAKLAVASVITDFTPRHQETQTRPPRPLTPAPRTTQTAPFHVTNAFLTTDPRGICRFDLQSWRPVVGGVKLSTFCSLEFFVGRRGRQ